MVIITSVVGRTNYTVASPLIHTYSNVTQGTSGPKYHVVRAPQYSSGTATGLTAIPWNGDVGGVLAVDVAGALTLAGAGAINVDGLGFRGSRDLRLTGDGSVTLTDYAAIDSAGAFGVKGEGYVGTPSSYVFAGTDYGNCQSRGRGAPGNAGGGGNGAADGLGGRAFASRELIDGLGGAAFTATQGQVMMGGGGGAGSNNDGTIDSSGGAGGGAIFLRAGSIGGGGTISANGRSAASLFACNGGRNDAAGGGGSLVALAANGLINATLQANGGAGGSNPGGCTPHGPGGRGGGGFIVESGGATTSVAAGSRGVTDPIGLDGAPYGSQNGAAGAVMAGTVTSDPGTRPGTLCLPVLKVTKTTTTPNRVMGVDMTATYSVTVANTAPAGGGTATGVNMFDVLPAPIYLHVCSKRSS